MTTDFWNDEEEPTGNAEIGGFQLIPEGTSVMFTIEGIEWIEPDINYPEQRIEIKWRIEKPQKYEDCMIFQKIKVSDQKESIATKAKKMFAAIDHNAGGKIRAAKKFPSDEIMAAALIGKTMAGVISVWKMNNNTGNFVNKILPASEYVEHIGETEEEEIDIPF